jgi:hypothetical protein
MPLPEHAPAADGIVIVDIGGDMGAAVICTPSELAGAEIEIRAAGTRWDGTHTAVHQRQGPGITATVAVFGSLRAGHYELRIKDAAGTEHPAPVAVEGAQVTWVTWAGATPSSAPHHPARRLPQAEVAQGDLAAVKHLALAPAGHPVDQSRSVSRMSLANRRQDAIYLIVDGPGS